jgi:hypothetical protein
VVARLAIIAALLIGLPACGGGPKTETGIPPVTRGEGATIAAGADALAWRAAEAICSQSTIEQLAKRYSVKPNKSAVKDAVATNFPQSSWAARNGCESGLFPTG